MWRLGLGLIQPIASTELTDRSYLGVSVGQSPLPTANCQLPTANRQPPAANYQPRTIMWRLGLGLIQTDRFDGTN